MVRSERVWHDLILDVASIVCFLLTVADQVVTVLNLLLRLLGSLRLHRVVLAQVSRRVRRVLHYLRVRHLVVDDVDAVRCRVLAYAMFVG